LHKKDGYNFDMFTDYINKIYSSLASVKLDTLMWIIFGSFAALFLITLVLCFVSLKIKQASKRPFLCLANAYSAVVLAAFLTADELPPSVLAAAIFWVAGYLAYGVLCFFSAPTAAKSAATVTLSTMPVQPPAISARPDMPAAKSSVRLEHAISVTDKLLLKNLGKGDRQELEKLKGTLSVLQTKGTLSPLESDILNDNFNALLKLMAKYNI